MKCDVLSIGAGREQVGPIRIARALGLRVLALDGNPEAEGLKEADHAIAQNPSHAQLSMEIARAAEVRALLPVPLGRLLAVAGEVTSELGLPGPRRRATMLSTDKLKMRRALAADGLSQPLTMEVAHGMDIGCVLRRFSGRMILKPRFGSGSRGVALVNCEAEANALLARFPGAACLAEEHVEGAEFGVDGYAMGGTTGILCIRLKELTPPPDRIGTGYLVSPEIHAKTESIVRAPLERAVTALGFTNCLWHADVILSENSASCWIIEISCRPSGYFLSESLVPAVCGINPYQQMLAELTDCGGGADFKPKFQIAGLCRLTPCDPVKARREMSSGNFADINGLVKLDIDLMTNAHKSQPRAIVITRGESLGEAMETFSLVKSLLG
jgi:biotin carboxylase